MLSLLHYNVVSLCHSFMTTELASLYSLHEESSRTLGILDVDGYIEGTAQSKEHTHFVLLLLLFLVCKLSPPPPPTPTSVCGPF